MKVLKQGSFFVYTNRNGYFSTTYLENRKTPIFNGGKDRRKWFGGLQMENGFSIFKVPNP